MRWIKFLTVFAFVLVASNVAPSVARAKGPNGNVSTLTNDPNLVVTSDGQVLNVYKKFPANAIMKNGAIWSPSILAKGQKITAPWEASPLPQPDRIIGADDRVQISNTTYFPESTVVFISSSGGSCTGFMIGLNRVATAGHCVHSGPGGNWFTINWVARAKNGASEPYGRCSATALMSTTGWTQNGDPNYDYGSIKLDCNSSSTLGLYVNANDSYFQGRGEFVEGYPSDKPYGTMWVSAGNITNVTTRMFFYTNDTTAGMSGSPVYSYHQDTMSTQADAINAQEYAPPTDNSGVRITQEVFNNLLNW
jgi:glutamyl endopeptidase